MNCHYGKQSETLWSLIVNLLPPSAEVLRLIAMMYQKPIFVKLNPTLTIIGLVDCSIAYMPGLFLRM